MTLKEKLFRKLVTAGKSAASANRQVKAEFGKGLRKTEYLKIDRELKERQLKDIEKYIPKKYKKRKFVVIKIEKLTDRIDDVEFFSRFEEVKKKFLKWQIVEFLKHSEINKKKGKDVKRYVKVSVLVVDNEDEGRAILTMDEGDIIPEGVFEVSKEKNILAFLRAIEIVFEYDVTLNLDELHIATGRKIYNEISQTRKQ